MKILKRLLSLIIISILLLQSIKTTIYASPNVPVQSPVNVGVFLNDFNDQFVSGIKKSLEDIQKENENKVHFTFYDAKGNQLTQNETIDAALNENLDLIVVRLVSTNLNSLEDIINKISQQNIPLILNSPPDKSLANFIRTYKRAVIIGADDDQSGILQGKILADAWNTNKKTIDRNKDNIMQYVMINGPTDNPAAIARTKYSIQTLNDEGIKTQQLLSTICNWEKDCARTTIESALLNLYDKIEVIIANNDAMAIGAIEALQKYGFNKGGNSKYIPVVGVDALPEAQELIKNGIMTGTVVQDPREQANAIYSIGMNLILGTNPLDGTNYKFDETGNTIKLPYHEYVK